MITKEYINTLCKKASNNVNEYIDLLYIKALSEANETNKCFSSEQFKIYLKRKGYVENYILGKTIYTKGFVCVYPNNDSVEIWHDTNNNKSILINDSYVTSLPIAMKYFERLN